MIVKVPSEGTWPNKAAEHYAARLAALVLAEKMNAQPSPYAVLIDCLQQDGLQDDAKELDELLRHIAWTTGSEFLGEFGFRMKRLKETQWDRMSDKTKQSFRIAAKTILKVWPSIGLQE